jgi:predicted acyl esterase
VVKLIDVYPATVPADTLLNGYELMVANDVLRGRYRSGFEQPARIPPNDVAEYTVDLHTQDYRFRRGHRIKVQVQSSWFPLIDRNPQTFVPNIFAAQDSDFRAATHRIYRSRDRASYVQVSVQTAH